MARLERKVQRINELLACFNQLQGLDLHMITQHQLFWIRMQIDLLVDALRHRMAPQMMLEQRQGDDQWQQLLTVVLDKAQELLLAVLPRQG